MKTVGELADLVRQLILEAQITLEGHMTDLNTVYQIDDRRVREEFGFTLSDLRETVQETIAETRRLAGPT